MMTEKPLLRRHPTEQELQCLQLIAEGMPAKVIAFEIGVTYRTVNEFLRHVYKRLGAKNAAHAVAIAYRDGILPLSEARVREVA